MRILRRRPARHLVAAALAVGLLACVEPTSVEPPPVTVDEDGDGPEGPAILDPTTDALREQVGHLRATVVAARDELRAAAEGDAADREGHARAALALLLDNPDTERTATGPSPLFPAATLDREGPAEQVDALTVTLALAREAGGTLGRATLEALRDPIAGDLGAWERDAAGVVAGAGGATATGGSLSADVDAVTEQVLALEGDGTRALAWTLAAVDATSPADIAVAADRAASHLGVVVIALDLLLDAAAAGDGVQAPTGPGTVDGADAEDEA